MTESLIGLFILVFVFLFGVFILELSCISVSYVHEMLEHASETASSATPGRYPSSETMTEVSLLLLSRHLLFLFFFIRDACDYGLWGIFWSENLNERVLMA